MHVERFYDRQLAQASYLVGCPASGEALVVDPHRDSDLYMDAAHREGLRVTHVTETHIHADFVSGSRELAHRCGARLHLSAEGGPDWRYRFAREEDAVLLEDGDRFMVGNVAIDVVHTPGHTPEHLSFLVTDTAAADRPIAALTGDFIFVGDVGRPDLLETAAGVKGTMEASARTLFRSLRAFKEKPDWLQVWPGHGAGSACGKGLSAIPHSTLGYEKLFNWALAMDDEDAFVEAVLEGQPEPPRYFAEMKRVNRDGPPILGGIPHPDWVPNESVVDLVDAGEVVVDARPMLSHASGHIPGTLSIPLEGSFTNWAGWLLPYDRDVHLVVAGENDAAEAVRALALIGLDRVAGVMDAGALEAWTDAGRELASVPQMSARAALRAVEEGSATVVDVRGAAEWADERIPGSLNVPVGYLTERLADLPRDRTLVLQCRSGARSGIASSVLEREGLTDVVNLAGGIQAWAARRQPLEGRTVEAASDSDERKSAGAAAAGRTPPKVTRRGVTAD